MRFCVVVRFFIRLMRAHLAFVVILGLTAIVRGIILLKSQTHVTSDEAIIGLMGKHILERRYFPFYFYGVPYNASCAWEAYLAAISFSVFGISTIALKIPMVILSLAVIAAVYVLTRRLFEGRLAIMTSVIFALWPGLLKWNSSPRGYQFYFLSVPILTMLFVAIDSSSTKSRRAAFCFGLACGISIWGMELIVILSGALWMLLILRRKFSIESFGVALTGLSVGYAPAIWWNITHSYANWRFLFLEKPEPATFAARFGLAAWREIFIHEMPKFFTSDTVLWYFPHSSLFGYVLYLVSAAAVICAALRSIHWEVVRKAFTSSFLRSDASKDFLLLILVGISFIPYVIAPLRVPGYFLGGVCFLSILIARMIELLVWGRSHVARAAGLTIGFVVLLCSAESIFQVATHNEIDTLSRCPNRREYCMTRIPGADIDDVKADLRQSNVGAIWTTISLVYPLIFETNETLIASESIFGIDRPVYPSQIPKPEPDAHRPSVFVVESDSPYCAEIELACKEKGGTNPRVTKHGQLTVIEERLSSDLP